MQQITPPHFKHLIIKAMPDYRLLGSVLLLAVVLLTTSQAQAQLPEWYLPNGYKVTFNNTNTYLPSSASSIIGAVPSGAIQYTRPDGLLWFYGDQASIIRLNINGGVTNTLNLLESTIDPATFPFGTNTNNGVEPLIALIPRPSSCDYTAIYGTTAATANPQQYNRPRSSFLCTALYNPVSPNPNQFGQSLTAMASSEVAGTSGTQAAALSTVAGPDAAGNYYLAVVATTQNPDSVYWRSLFYPNGDPFAGNSSVWHSKVAVYKVAPSGAISVVGIVKGDAGEVREELIVKASSISLSSDGYGVVWTVDRDSQGVDVVVADLSFSRTTANPFNRTRTHSFAATDITRNAGGPTISSIFVTGNRRCVIVTGGAATGSKLYDGVTSLNFNGTFGTLDPPVIKTTSVSSKASARDVLVLGFGRNLYGVALGSTANARFTKFDYNGFGLATTAPVSTTLGFPIAAIPRASLPYWHYNYLKLSYGPISALAPAGGTVSIGFTGPTTQTGATVSYQWYKNGSLQTGETAKSYTADYAGSSAGISHPGIYVQTSLTVCGQTYTSPSPQKTLTVFTDPYSCPGCRPAPPTNQDALVALPNLVRDWFSIQPVAGPEAGAERIVTTVRYRVSIFDTYGQSVLSLPTYDEGAPINVSAWRSGVYQAVVTPLDGSAPQRLKLFVTR